MLLRKRALVGLQGELAAALLQSELASTPGRRRAQLADRSAGAEGRTFQAEGRRDFTSVFDCPAPGGVRSAEAAAARSARAAVPAARQGSAPEQRAAAGRGVQHALWPQRACVASCRCPRCRLLGTHRYSSATKSSCRCVRCRVLGTHSYSSATVDDKAREIDRVNELFVAAREEIDYAQEDAETTYFNESVDTAKGAVAEAFAAYDTVLKDLSEGERGKLQRAMGLKMEQLKAELAQLDHLHA